MKKPPKISCILPVFNGSRFIGEALDSILAQSLPVADIIVVDDGSTDGLQAALAEFKGRICLIRQDNQGPAAARNRGVRESTGDYLAFLDADDIWHKDKLKRQMDRFEAVPSLQLSMTYQRPFWVPEMQEEQARLLAEDHPFPKDHPGHVCQSMLMPRTTFLRVGEFNESLRIGEDTDWLLRARELGIVTEMLPEVLFYRRMHQNNLSYSAYADGAEKRLGFLVEQLKRRRAGASGAGDKP